MGVLRFAIVLALACIFGLIGILFVAAPEPAANVFGIPAHRAAHPYIRALGFRDLALALYLAGLVWTANVGALKVVLGASVLIPICDVALILTHAGWSAIGSIALHAAVGIVLAALAWSCPSPGRSRVAGP